MDGMQRLSLGGDWTLQIAGQAEVIPATVPGSVYNDLLTQGLMEDPFYRDNEEAALQLMENDFLYRRTFSVPASLLGADAVLLRCDGLDTLASVRINDQPVGEADNMHRVWEFDVSDVLREGDNTIEIRFASPTKWIRSAYAENPYEGSSDAMRGFVHLRKAHCMFGWDWGPRLPDCGIWRDIALLGIETARIEGVYVRQAHEAGRVALSLDIELSAPGEVEVTVTAPDGRAYAPQDDGRILIDDPKLWWPNGFGEQPLYTVTVELSKDGRALDSWSRRIGLRTVTMHREKDSYGESFYHEVNGVGIFAMGADYIPEDNLLPRVTPARTRALLEDAKAANFNCVRIWGGGHYPSDAFYDICDELGLLVWQDFMFACGAYALTDAFEANIRAEFRDNIRRLRHHASLALWCGNNEMEMFAAMGHWVSTPKQKSEYIRMYEYIIPDELKRHDPVTFYWPSSSSSGGSFDAPNDPNRGDVHYWDVWHGEKPFYDYRNYYFRYASEFGFQAYPHLKTVESFTLPEDRNAFSYVMEKHQRNAAANGKIMKYIAQTYLYPKDFASLVYASQMLQADAIRYGVEHWRRNRGRCMGAVIWQLNDCWPVISWSSIDYYGRWKALHYAAKRFFAPVLLSANEEGPVTQKPDVNIEIAEPIRQSVRLTVSNETLSAQRVSVRWAWRRADSSLVQEGEGDLLVEPLSVASLPEIDLSALQARDEYVSYALYQDGEQLSFGTALLSPPKHFRFVSPNLRVRAEAGEVVVEADAYARGVFIDSADGDLLLSDNWFDMDKGTRRLKVLRGDASGLTVRSVYDIDK